MRVIHLARYAGPYPGSFIAMLRAAAAEGDRRGWRTEAVFDPVAADRPWYAELGGEMAVRVSPDRAGRGDLVRYVRDLLAEEDGPTLLHTHFTGFDLASAAAARGRPATAVVWHLHTRLDPGPRVVLRNALKFRALSGGVQRIVCVGPDIAAAARRRLAPRARLAVVENGIDVSRFPLASDDERAQARAALDLPAGRPVLVHFGWDWEMKGGPLFASAAGVLRDRGFDALAVSVGATALADGAVITRPPRDDVRSVYAAADVVVSSSEVEGGPFSVLEALAVGTPVVASPRANAGVGGVLAACRVAERTPEAFADVVAATLARPAEQAAAEREAAREYVAKERDISAWARRIADIQEQAMAAA